MKRPNPTLDPGPLLAMFPTLTPSELADELDVSTRQIYRWRQGQRITTWKADEIAVLRLGVHPFEVWGEEWHASDDEAA